MELQKVFAGWQIGKALIVVVLVGNAYLHSPEQSIQELMRANDNVPSYYHQRQNTRANGWREAHIGLIGTTSSSASIDVIAPFVF